jgi:hypothetical protein
MEAERYRLVPSHKMVLLPSTPAFEWKEWAATMQAVFQDHRFSAPMGFLVDRRNVEQPYSRTVIERILRFFASYSSHMRGCSWAALIPDLGPVRDAVRIVSTLASPCGLQIRAFVEFRGAVEWTAPTSRRVEREAYLNWLNLNGGRSSAPGASSACVTPPAR